MPRRHRRLRDRADHAITAWCERELGRARQDLAEDTGDMSQRESRPEPCGSDRNECEELMSEMARRPRPRRARFLLILPLAVVPAAVVTVALWPVTSSNEVPAGLPANGAVSFASRDLDENHLLKLLAARNRNGEGTSRPGQPPSSVSAGGAPHAGFPEAPVPPQTAVQTTRAATGDAAREARVRQEALQPHPQPPATPLIAPNVQASISAANHQPTITLGTLTPPPPSRT
jgi:hypothetical protein